MQTIQQMIDEIKQSERLRLSKLIGNFGVEDKDNGCVTFQFDIDAKPVIATYIDDGAEPVDLVVAEVYVEPGVSNVIRMDGYDNTDRYGCIYGTEIKWAFVGQITELADALEYQAVQRYRKFRELVNKHYELTGEGHGQNAD